jgi:tRNA1(Val) A37 N6-methylase TrmN6
MFFLLSYDLFFFARLLSNLRIPAVKMRIKKYNTAKIPNTRDMQKTPTNAASDTVISNPPFLS